MLEVTVEAPATVANVNCGFDCLGFAIREPFDEMTIRRIKERTVRISHLDSFGLPVDPNFNVAGLTLLKMLAESGADFGFELEITKHIKPGSGIGSSAASSAGAAVAANFLLDEMFSKQQLVEMAIEGESLASGARHADNLAPCVYGGFTLVRSIDPIDIIPLEFPQLYATVLHPHIEIKTADARSILPADIPLKSAVKQWSNLGAFIAALASGDMALLSRSMQDVIIEPLRRSLIPGFDKVKQAAADAGSLGCGISGSGPSIFMLSDSLETAEAVNRSVQEVYRTTNISFDTYVSEICPQGVRSRS